MQRFSARLITCQVERAGRAQTAEQLHLSDSWQIGSLWRFRIQGETSERSEDGLPAYRRGDHQDEECIIAIVCGRAVYYAPERALPASCFLRT